MIRIGLLSLILTTGLAWAGSYPIVDSGQTACFDDSRQVVCPLQGDRFNGQDGQYKGNMPRYQDNGDGTVSDLVTGLMWVQARGEKMPWQQAMDGAAECRVGNHDDWRAPTIKELYSLIDFNGWQQITAKTSTPFIDTKFFEFAYGDTAAGERVIDCQDWSATSYVGTTMGGAATAFGVNFADGRIKGYPKASRGGRHGKYIRYVRGNTQYGLNDFVDNGDGTVLDKATGLTWQQADSGRAFNWEDGLSYCENLRFAGRDDWRLPSVKELQSIVDYARSPVTSGSAAIDPVFSVTDPESYFWSSTTHMDGPRQNYAAYVAFGRAMGYFAPPRSNAAKRFLDVHGAGAQRSDPKSGDPSKFSQGHGPQGDDVRINNYVRCVTGGGVAYYEPTYSRIPTWKGGKQAGAGQQGEMGQQGRGGPGKSRPGVQRVQGRSGHQGMRQGPPQEAFDACAEKAGGSKCTVRTPHGTISGLCRDMDGGVACVPEDGPMGRRRRQ